MISQQVHSWKPWTPYSLAVLRQTVFDDQNSGYFENSSASTEGSSTSSVSRHRLTKQAQHEYRDYSGNTVFNDITTFDHKPNY